MIDVQGDMPSTPTSRPGILHPWRLMLLALLATGAAFIWARLCDDEQVPLDAVQVTLLSVGVLAAGGAIWIRCAIGRADGLNELSDAMRFRAYYAVAGVHVLLALGVSAWVVLKLGGRGSLPGDVGGTLLLWLLTVPWCAYSAFQLVQRAGARDTLDERFETAVLVTQGGVAALLASWALYWGPNFSDAWDSFRLFLAVVAAVALLAAPLVAASSVIRRIAVSTLIVLHFAAILCVVIGAQPGPWIFAQSQHWIFRPYIDFMYLNNAYRFYSPEPGPASQLWFRIEYENANPRWVKLPSMDDDGTPKYWASLQYTRRLALTENVARVEPVPWMLPNAKGESDVAPFAMRRFQHLPMQKAKLGLEIAKNSLDVPLHPEMQLNYQMPTAGGRQLLGAYARHVLAQAHPTNASAKPVAVKIYRVQHRILLAEGMARGADPRDWIYFLPYYVGKYDVNGQLLDPQDPFLYWLLPIMREAEEDPKSRLKCYFIKHAGDAEWVLPSPLVSRHSPLNK
ncbi:MAG TPA: hypothetical protein VE988_02065 [Gemmataceae bacterium]|nr:hypothetical protein [Gemmataceae bacterium]